VTPQEDDEPADEEEKDQEAPADDEDAGMPRIGYRAVGQK
jgi:hypothetical protein